MHINQLYTSSIVSTDRNGDKLLAVMFSRLIPIEKMFKLAGSCVACEQYFDAGIQKQLAHDSFKVKNVIDRYSISCALYIQGPVQFIKEQRGTVEEKYLFPTYRYSTCRRHPTNSDLCRNTSLVVVAVL